MKNISKEKANIQLGVLLKTICAFLPTIWIPVIINWLGQYIGFVKIDNGNKVITAWGWIVTIVVFAVIFWRLYASNSNSDIKTLKEDNEVLEQNNTILDDIISRLIHISTKKYENQVNYIENLQKKFGKDDFINLINPKEEIKVILDDISFNFFLLTREFLVKHQDIVVTLAYCLKGKWQWIESSSAQDGLSLEVLVKEPGTTIYKLINSKQSFIFHACKLEASKRNEYKFDERDADNLHIGSIVCKKINCGNSINAILSISTYGHKMVDKDADISRVRDTIKNVLVPFEKRIMEEFILLHAKNKLEE